MYISSDKMAIVSAKIEITTFHYCFNRILLHCMCIDIHKYAIKPLFAQALKPTAPPLYYMYV